MVELKVKPINLILNAKKGEDYIYAGNEFYNAMNYPLAIEMYGIAINSGNVNPIVFFNRACAYMACGIFGKAVNDFSIYTKLIPADNEALEQKEMASFLLKTVA